MKQLVAINDLLYLPFIQYANIILNVRPYMQLSKSKMKTFASWVIFVGQTQEINVKLGGNIISVQRAQGPTDQKHLLSKPVTTVARNLERNQI